MVERLVPCGMRLGHVFMGFQWTISVSLLAVEELVMGWATVSWAMRSWAAMDLGHGYVGPQWVWP